MVGTFAKSSALSAVDAQKQRWRQLRAAWTPADCARRMRVGLRRAARLEMLFIGQASLLLNRKGRRLAVQNQRHVKAVLAARADGFAGPWSCAYGGDRYAGEPRMQPHIDWQDRATRLAKAAPR